MNGFRDYQKLGSVQSVNPLIGIEKRCRKCGNKKPISEFSKDKKCPSGYASPCRKCRTERQRIQRHDNKEHTNLINKKAREKHRDIYLANQAVYYAVKMGVLIKPDVCTVCGAYQEKSRDIHAHHEDYNKRLDVLWVCRDCHQKIHTRKFEKEYLAQLESDSIDNFYIFCACGCGNSFLKYDKFKRPRTYIRSHQPRNPGRFIKGV